jgi:hypothetical protein
MPGIGPWGISMAGRESPEPVVLPAILSGLGGLGAALIGRSAQNRGYAAQERATSQRIQLERERDAARQRRYDQSMENYRREKDQYDTIRRSLLSHYGITLPTPSAPGGATGAAPGGAPPGAGAQGMSLGDLMGGRGGVAGPMGGGGGGFEPPAPAAPGPGGPPAAPVDPFKEDILDWRRYA